MTDIVHEFAQLFDQKFHIHFRLVEMREGDYAPVLPDGMVELALEEFGATITEVEYLGDIQEDD
ncbi:MAG: hypothetical protein PVI81_08860 [Anaerolineales bacterium]|jgi:hypothetical protein